MELGMHIKQIRESKGLSVYRITQETGISGHHIKGIEDGTRQPTIETLQRLIKPLGITMAELFNDGDCTFLNEKERMLIENFRSLDEEKADALLNISKVLKK